MSTFASEPSLETDLRRHLGKLVNDPSDLPMFRQWFSKAAWDAESDDDVADDTLALAHRVENLLAILNSSRWDRTRFIAAVQTELDCLPSIELTGRRLA